jgi:hypothetical protein
MKKIPIGGTWAFWVKVTIGLVVVYLLWKLYQGAKAASATIGDVVDRGKRIFMSEEERLAEIRTLPDYQAKKDWIYDPALDPRSWWDKLWSLAPPEAFRPPEMIVGVGTPLGGDLL